MEIVFLLIGIILGGTAAWFISQSKYSSTSSGVSADEYNQLDKENGVLEIQLKIALEDKDRIARELSEEREKLQLANTRLGKAEETFKSQNEKITSLQSDYKERFEYQQKEFNEKLNKQQSEFDELQKRFTLEFQNIANKILEENSKKFTELNKSNLDVVLNPLNEKIKDFGEKVEKIYKAESDERITLKTEIKNLVELNKQISQEANNLATALKGDNKKQGNWGEYILEQILERSGLVKGREYDTQVTTTNISNDIIKPDIIIYLPDKKHVVIDSKVSLVAYEAMVSAETEEDRLRYQKEHLASVKNHVKSLSEKGYHTSKDLDTPEFVLLFIPIESSFSTAVQASEDLFNFAWEKRIVLVSPSTLFATLCTIASVWKQERQKNNVLKIAEIGGKLYDQFARFVEDMQDIDKSLKRSQEAYDSAFKRLKTGNGNLISSAEKMKSLGAKAQKSIDPTIVDEANENLLN
jgi:DNA recombination protein RmuC